MAHEVDTRAQTAVFKAGSTTYFNSSLFFPPDLLDEVKILYGFVRVADDYVDAVPQDAAGFRAFVTAYRGAMAGNAAGNPVIDDFVALGQRADFDPAWTDAFLAAMEADLSKRFYQTETEVLEYVYGSAEVIGLYMARLMKLRPEAEHCARMLGRAMQYINFIRDVAEDLELGRRYLPVEGTGLPADWLPDPAQARERPDEWSAFLARHLERYRVWQTEAEAGYHFLPRRSRIAVKTAADMYNWTGRVIAADPLVVFERKVKPHKARIIMRALGNVLWC